MSTEQKDEQKSADELARQEAKRIEEAFKKSQVQESTYQTVDGQLLIG